MVAEYQPERSVLYEYRVCGGFEDVPENAGAFENRVAHITAAICGRQPFPTLSAHRVTASIRFFIEPSICLLSEFSLHSSKGKLYANLDQ
jgi:hypothetical protein